MRFLEADAKKYWNPLMERIPLEPLRALQLQKFKKDRCLGLRAVKVPSPPVSGSRVGARGYPDL